MPTPLIDTAGAEQYIPRAATESVLAHLEAVLDGDARFVVLSGPPGLGKTLLLHVLEDRQRSERQVIFSPFLHFHPDEALVWLRGLLRENRFETEEASDPARAPGGSISERRLLLILDEAQSMPLDTAASLAGMLPGFARRMRVLLAGIEGPRLDRVVERIGEPVERVRLESRISPGETREFVDRAMRSRSEGSMGSPASSEVEVGAYHAAAEGNPRVLKALMFRAELGEPPPVIPVESSEPREAPDGAGEGPLTRNAEVESEASMGSIVRSATAPVESKALVADPVEPKALVADEVGARPWASGVVAGKQLLGDLLRSGSARISRHTSTIPRHLDRGWRTLRYASKRVSERVHLLGDLLESGSARISRHASTIPRHVGRGWRTMWQASKHAFERVQRLEMVIVATSIVMGFLVAHLVLPAAPPSTSPAGRSALLAEVSAPPPVWITTAVAEPAAKKSDSAAPSLDPRRTDEGQPAAPVVSDVTLHINARPWASIRLDGEEIGLTPLSRSETRLGRHEFEAEFPDGRIVKRVVEVSADSRFISFP